MDKLMIWKNIFSKAGVMLLSVFDYFAPQRLDPVYFNIRYAFSLNRSTTSEVTKHQ